MNDVQAKEAVVARRTDAERAFCDAEFWKIIGSDMRAPMSPEKIAAWKALAPKCSGTGLYESRLVGMVTSSGKLDEARRLGLDALKRPLESRREVLLAMAQVELHADNYGSAIEYANLIIKEDRQWSGGYTALGEIYLSQGKFSEAVTALENSLKHEGDGSVAASLCIAYRGAGRYLESAQAMQTALKADISTLRYTKAVAAAADSLVQINQVPAAQDLLEKHAGLVPNARQDPDFTRSAKLVANALKTAKSK